MSLVTIRHTFVSQILKVTPEKKQTLLFLAVRLGLKK